MQNVVDTQSTGPTGAGSRESVVHAVPVNRAAQLLPPLGSPAVAKQCVADEQSTEVTRFTTPVAVYNATGALHVPLR